MKLDDITAGDILVADAGFTCMDNGALAVVQKDEKGVLYIHCACERHYLGGQVNEAGELVGLKRLDPTNGVFILETERPIPRDVAELVISARIVVDEDRGHGAIERLRTALVAFEDRLPKSRTREADGDGH